MTSDLSHHDLCRLVAKLQAERADLRDRLTSAVMNLACDLDTISVKAHRTFYTLGHRDARHQAVEAILEILGEG